MHLPLNTSLPPQARHEPVDIGDGFPRPGTLEVLATSASGLPDALANAVDVVSRAADEHRIGILISRIGTNHYIVRAHPGVPYGMIRQPFG